MGGPTASLRSVCGASCSHCRHQSQPRDILPAQHLSRQLAGSSPAAELLKRHSRNSLRSGCSRRAKVAPFAVRKPGSSEELGAGLALALGSVIIYLLGADSAVAADLHASQGPAFHPVSADLQNLAQNEDFWNNLARYGRYFLTVLLGTAYTAIKPLGGLLRNPVTAVVVIASFVGLYFFLKATLSGMLGVGQEPLTLIDF